ncbi:MAG: hypothetical protein NC934_06970 [Candidatus Omnitrophica bacterium]|nr:hypothetical protein [Candidatus Omnitrophota bacterium]
MKDKVKELLKTKEEKDLWDEIYNAFQEGGEKKVEELIKEKKKTIEDDFENLLEKLNKKFGGEL